MQPAKHISICSRLFSFIVIVGVLLVFKYTEKQDARYLEAVKVIEESKRTIEAVQKQLQAIQQQQK